MKTPEELADEYADLWPDMCINGARKGFLAGYRAAAPQWISVKDRLPEDGDDLSIMLVWRGIEHDYDTVRWRYQQGWDYDTVRWRYQQGWDCVIQDKATITHWMPLPAAPKEEA